jgi:hypothetical protein
MKYTVVCSKLPHIPSWTVFAVIPLKGSDYYAHHSRLWFSMTRSKQWLFFLNIIQYLIFVIEEQCILYEVGTELLKNYFRGLYRLFDFKTTQKSKVVTWHNKAPCHEDLEEVEYMNSYILNLGGRWRWVAMFTFRAPCSEEAAMKLTGWVLEPVWTLWRTEKCLCRESSPTSWVIQRLVNRLQG